MRLVVRADASARIGTGHVMRCLALCQAWRESGGSATLVSAELSDPIAGRLVAEGISVRRIDALAGSGDDAAATVAIAAEVGADWVVVDGYRFGESFHRRVGRAPWRLAAIDDHGHCGSYDVDLLLNQNFHADTIRYVVPAQCRLLLGCRYALLRREFASWRGPQRRYAREGHHLLILVGGADPCDHLSFLLNALVRGEDIKSEITAIVGPANLRGPALAAQFGARVRLVFNPDNLVPFIRAADLVLSSAGSTVWELALFGTPMILGAITPQEEINASHLANLAAARHLGLFGQCAVDRLRGEVRLVAADQGLRSRLGAAAAGLVDGQGANRVVSELRALEGAAPSVPARPA